MYTFEVIQKTRDYLDYVEEHIKNVEKAWEVIQAKCKNMRFVHDDFYFTWLNHEVMAHDLSKLSEHELVQYRRHFFPTEAEQLAGKYALEDGWRHHVENNPHHWQNWTISEYFNPNEWKVHCVHMIIDWMAMGYKFGDTPREYYEANRDGIAIPDYAIRFIYEIFDLLEAE